MSPRRVIALSVVFFFFLSLLYLQWAEMSKMKISDKKQVACDEIFQTEEEYCLYEAVKFLMLRTAVDLYNANENGVEVPVFSWLLFARNTSNNPCEFMKNHLNQVGHSGGLEQVCANKISTCVLNRWHLLSIVV